jgi:hypothetical protein
MLLALRERAMCPSDDKPTTTDDVWIEFNLDALGLSPDAKVTYSNNKLFRISASGSLLEVGECKALVAAGKIKVHDTASTGWVRAPRAAFR